MWLTTKEHSNIFLLSYAFFFICSYHELVQGNDFDFDFLWMVYGTILLFNFIIDMFLLIDDSNVKHLIYYLLKSVH